jgi:hypothetical protein
MGRGSAAPVQMSEWKSARRPKLLEWGAGVDDAGLIAEDGEETILWFCVVKGELVGLAVGRDDEREFVALYAVRAYEGRNVDWRFHLVEYTAGIEIGPSDKVVAGLCATVFAREPVSGLGGVDRADDIDCYKAIFLGRRILRGSGAGEGMCGKSGG